jgi:alkanesulfonate monooxygenase SsuD/methylene tetrahydromethanopterin reductase-like flavin-dependent oxidoreductase (luciferase family)
MSPLNSRIGIVLNRVGGVNAALSSAQTAEALGFGAAWLTNGGPEDPMPLLAALALKTDRIRLGTSVLQTYPRHPYVVATEANVIDQLSPGRLRLGLGPSHDLVMESLGIHRDSPLRHLSEYVTVVRSLVSTGSVQFSGVHYSVTARLDRAFDLPIMVGALQPAAFRLAGSAADGAITWLCPPGYLASVALPTMTRAAADSDRERPPLIAHLAACVHDVRDDVHDAVRQQIPNIAFPTYQRMLVASGFDDAAEGRWSESLIDHIIAWGTAEHVAFRIQELFDIGADEVLIRPIGAGARPTHVIERTMRSVAAAFE